MSPEKVFCPEFRQGVFNLSLKAGSSGVNGVQDVPEQTGLSVCPVPHRKHCNTPEGLSRVLHRQFSPGFRRGSVCVDRDLVEGPPRSLGVLVEYHTGVQRLPL